MRKRTGFLSKCTRLCDESQTGGYIWLQHPAAVGVMDKVAVALYSDVGINGLGWSWANDGS